MRWQRIYYKRHDYQPSKLMTSLQKEDHRQYLIQIYKLCRIHNLFHKIKSINQTKAIHVPKIKQKVIKLSCPHSDFVMAHINLATITLDKMIY